MSIIDRKAAAAAAAVVAPGKTSHTTAELYAYNDATRPAIPLPCSDCLTTRGVGANCCWDVGAQVWRTMECITATTDLWTFYRSMALDWPSGNSTTRKMSVVSGAGPSTTQNTGSFTPAQATSGVSGPSGVIGFRSNSSAASGVRMTPSGSSMQIVSTSLSESFYGRAFIGASAQSSAAEEYNFRIGGDVSDSYVCPASCFGFAYDRGNTLGALNPTNSHNLIFFARKVSTNTLRDTGVALAATSPIEHLIEFLFDGTDLRFAVNGIEGTPIAASDVPAAQLLHFACFNKSAGTSPRSVYLGCPFSAARYTNAVA